MIQQRAYDKESEYDSIAADAGTVTSITDNGNGKCRVVTTGVHGIYQGQVDSNHDIIIASSGVGAYDTTHRVTYIIDINTFDTNQDYVSDAVTGTFPVEKIYRCGPSLLTSIIVSKQGEILPVYVCLQQVPENDKHSSHIVWVQVGTDTKDYFKGDSTLIQGLKVSGNPSAECKIVCAQGQRF